MSPQIIFYKKRHLVCALMFLCCSVCIQGQSVFHALSPENNTLQLRATFTSSDTISLEGLSNIYSLSIDAIIHQPQEDSFTRIVLEDKDGNDYLVAESNWFRFDTTNVCLSHYCEETAILNGIIPFCLKCYVTGDATVTLMGINSSNIADTRNADKFAETTKLIKDEQVKDIVDRINSYNTKHGRLWRAAVTEISLLPYKEKKNIYEEGSCDSYLNNIQYYSGGLYEVGQPRAHAERTMSPYVPSFDWRYRHGKNWLTSVKDQGRSGYCTAFAAVGMLESNMLLHYNDTSSIDLSEQYVASYAGVDYFDGAPRGTPVRFLKTNGTIDDDSMPFVDSEYYTPPSIRPEGEEHVYLNDYKAIYLSNNLPLDTLKKYIIQNGPGVCGFQCFVTPYTHDKRNGGHAMTLAGYGIIVPDTAYTFCNGHYPTMYFHENDSVIGHTYWIYKNSWGKGWGHNGYMYAVYYNDDRSYMGSYAYFPKGMPSSNVSHSIICEDKDGDGIFNWGIGSTHPHIPVWAPNESDGDDSDPSKGHMNEYGYCEELPTNHPSYEYISNDSTLTTPESRTKYLGILCGAMVTIQAQQNFSNGTKLLLDNGATLIIDGITINGSSLQPYAGSKIILQNGAKILKPFIVPLGVEFVMNKGKIE